MSDAQNKLTRLEALSDDELLEKAWTELSALCGSSGPQKKWLMSIPVDADRDSDILFGEVLKRYAALRRDLKYWKDAHSVLSEVKSTEEFAADMQETAAGYPHEDH